MRLAWAPPVLAGLGALAAAACHDLPDLGTCGNGIVEEANGEACDEGRDTDACKATCELKCARSEPPASYVDVGGGAFCPGAEYRCGTDDVCRAPSGFFELFAQPLPFDIGAAPTTGDVDNDGLLDLVGTSATNIYIRYASTTGAPLGEVVVQEAPSGDAPAVIFDPRPATQNPLRSELLFAVPSEGVALLQSDDERFSPEPELAIRVPGVSAAGLVVRDPDPVERLGDVVVSVESRSTTPAIQVGRVRVEKPDKLDPPAVAERALPACTGLGAGAWHLVDVETAGDRDAFVVITQRDGAGAQPWHVCRYTHGGGSWIDAQVELAPQATITEASLANLDGDTCLELALRGAAGLLVIDAAGTGCDLAPAATPLPLAGEPATLLAAGPIVTGGVDELVLANGVYRACTTTEDCGGPAVGTFIRAAAPTNTPWIAAAVVDLNRDGDLDVVAGRGDPEVDVVRGGKAPNVYRVSTSAPVPTLVAGDFDGDRLGDVAMTERSPMGMDRIVVLFGSQEATVAAPRAMSGPNGVGGQVRLDRFTQASWIPSSRGTDGIDDLAIVKPGAVTEAGFALGDAARLMTTPRFPPNAVARRPLAGLTAGAFHGGELEILAFDGDRAVFYNAADLMGAMWSPPSAPGLALHNPAVALRDAGRPARGAASLGAGGNELVVFAVRGLDLVQVCPSPIQASGRFLTELRAVDVDGDGVDEVAVGSDDGDPGTRRLQIFSAGGCRPMLEDELAGCVDVANVANIGSRLVAVCRLDRGTMGPARGVFTLEEPQRLIASFPVGDNRFVTPGDYDGDGVLDLALSVHRVDEVVVHYLRQCPAHNAVARDCK